MKFGLIYPSSSGYVDLELFRATTREAEDNGFEFFFVWDHYMLPQSTKHKSWSNRNLEAFQALSYAAALTRTIKLSTVVTPIPFRNVLALAKMASFLDFLSNGRFVLGAGLGWNEAEFRYYSEWKPAAERFRETEEGLRTLQAMWKGSTRDGVLPEVDPRPSPDHSIPIWFGTTGRRMMKLCAEIGSGWIPSAISPEEFGAKMQILESLLRENHKSLGDFTFAVDSEDQLLPSRNADYLIRGIEQYTRAGANLVCQTWQYDPLDREAFLKKIHWYSEEVMHSF